MQELFPSWPNSSTIKTLNSRGKSAHASPTFPGTRLILPKLLLTTIYSPKSSTVSKTTIPWSGNMRLSVSGKSQNKTLILPNWSATQEEPLPLLTLSLRLRDRPSPESSPLGIFLLLTKLWLWELSRPRALLLSNNHSRTKMKVLGLLQLGVWDRWADTLPTTPKLLPNRTFPDFSLNFTETQEVRRIWRRRQKKLWKVSSRCVPT